MGNAQGNQSDNRSFTERHRKASTVRGRVLARLKSRNSLQARDNNSESLTVVHCDNEFTNIRTEIGIDLHETADRTSCEKAEKANKRISQISQGADSAKEAIDFAKRKQFDCKPSSVPFEQISEIKTSATRAPSLPTLPSTTLAKSFHRIPSELHVSLTSTTSENTKTVTSSPADCHELNQTSTTPVKRVSSKELWEESTNVRTNDAFSNCLVLNYVVVSNASDETVFGNEKQCVYDSKIDDNKGVSSHLCEHCQHEKNIIFSTRSWNIARRISDLFKRRRSQITTEITNKLTPSTTDIIVLREQTTSSSSDSIFTDPLTTPIGFATEINQCYYSEENVCDTSDVDKLDQLAGETVPSRIYSRKTKSNSDILNKLSKLSLTNVDCYTTAPNYCSETLLDTSDELDTTMSLANNIQKVNRMSPSNIENCTDKMNIFNVARVKKVELAKVGNDSVSATINEAQLIPTILQQPSITPPTPSSILAPSVCSPTSQGDGNVLKKVASFTVERTNSDNTASKISRPSYVPEKLNFGAYEKFEGQMLLNWMSSSSQPLYNVSDQDISSLLIQQYCTNLLVAGVIKQIPDKYAPIQETFRPNLMYEWTHGITPRSSTFYNSKIRNTVHSANDVFNGSNQPKAKEILDSVDVDLIQNRLNVIKSKFNDFHMETVSVEVLSEVFKDLEMICSELLAVQKKLQGQHYLFNETDNDLYLSCVNETINLGNFSVLKNEKSLYEEYNSTADGTHNTAIIGDYKQTTCDRINICKNCGRSNSKIEKTKVPETALTEKWTQTESSSPPKNETKTNLETSSLAKTPVASPAAKLNQSIQNMPPPQPMPPVPPTPPPMPPPFSSTPSSSSVVSRILAPAPPPPPPPPMPSIPPPPPMPSIPPPPPMPSIPPPPPMPSIPPPPPMPSIPPPPPQPTMQPIPPALPSIPPIPPPPPPLAPPLPGNLTTTTPQPSTSAPAPPPPPPLLGPPPPPMPPLQKSNDTVDGVESSSTNGLNGLVGPSSSSPSTTLSPSQLPAPLPMPTVGNAWFQSNTLRKNALKPPKPMKPLYWTRIVASTVSTPQSNAPAPTDEVQLWQEIDETSLDNLDEFTELFSRPIIEPKKVKEETQKPTKVKTIKVLDSKRSQSVGIFSRSLHVNFHEIEHAIYHCDTSVVSLEALQTLMEIKATPEELEMIHAAASQGAPLDPPEEFLLKISNFSCSAERISCIVFQSDFEEGSLSVTKKLNTVMSLCEVLIQNENLKSLFSIILTLGNYMNGGNRQRGQADGFGLEILAKLKDVKSKDSKVTLLHFIVKTYISRCRKAGTPLNDIDLPIPDPGDVAKAVVIDFKEIEDQVNGLQTKLKDCRKIADVVISKSTEETLQPFKDQMELFHDTALKRIDKLTKKLSDSKEIFLKTLKFYKFMPKSGPLAEVTPGQFFEYWAPFTNDFRDIWKKEMALLNNEIMQKARAIYNKNSSRTAERKITPTKPGSLKEKMLRLRKKQNEKLS